MKICIVTPIFAIAGVPLAQLRSARAFSSAGHQVDLVIGHIDPHYQLPDVSGVNILNLNQSNVRGMLFPLMRYLKTAKPNVSP